MTFGTSVQLLGFSFFTWRTGMFQDAATRCAVCKSAPWALPGSCLEAETLRSPPSRDSQNQSLPCNKVPRWSFLTVKFDKHWSWWLFPKTRRKSYGGKKRKRETFPLHFTISHLFNRNNYSPRLSVSGKAHAATCEFN